MKPCQPNYKELAKILPEFPRTKHLWHCIGASLDDVFASKSEIESLLKDTAYLSLEEKVDGANMGMMLHKGEPLVRNRHHILRKGYLKDTPAKQQFRPVWNWFYENLAKFERLASIGPLAVYGEWCYAQHGIEYTQLPDWFLAFDLYNYEEDCWLAPAISREILTDLEFHMVPRVVGPTELSLELLKGLATEKSSLGASQREGVYLKVDDDQKIVGRYKAVRDDYVCGALWCETELKKNTLARAVAETRSLCHDEEC